MTAGARLSQPQQEWHAGGQRLRIRQEEQGPERGVFVRVQGAGPVVTLLHGFPTSSWDWARVEPLLVAAGRTVVSVDLLGYGRSDKPNRHRYSTAEHARVVLAVWESLGVKASTLVAHDVGTSVAQELLALDREGRVRVDLDGVLLLNGGLFTDHYVPARTTRLLAGRMTGPVLARLMREERFIHGVAALFSDSGRPPEAELRQHWHLLIGDGGRAALPRLMHYLADKQANKERWHDALTRTDVPLSVLWGAADTAIPLAVLDDVRRYLPHVPVTELAGSGHFPHIEDPDAVAMALGLLTAGAGSPG